jgi:hypothetical protein
LDAEELLLKALGEWLLTFLNAQVSEQNSPLMSTQKIKF